MRKQIGCTVRARAGDRVRFVVTMPDTVPNVDCGIFSAMKGHELAPFIQADKTKFLNDGRPRFLSPVLLRLHDQRPTGETTVIADDNCRFAVLQDVDSSGKIPLATVKVWKNDKRQHDWRIGQRVFSTFRWAVGKWERMVRGQHARQVR